ncbi:MAG: hypothetical protein LBS63_05110, partial [Prevotellaceae bacterium]|nr:hypothetical protein [Prevotellaceae bacterium]
MDREKNIFDEEEVEEKDMLVRCYEGILANDATSCYFSELEYEHIIGFYIANKQMKEAMQAIALGERSLCSPLIQLCKATAFAFDSKPRKALKLLEHIERSYDEDELDTFKLKFCKAYALAMLGQHYESIVVQQDLLDNEVEDIEDVEQLLTLIVGWLFVHEQHEAVLDNLQYFEPQLQLPSHLLGYMAYSCSALDRPDKAVSYYKQAVQQDPFEPCLWCSMADLLEDEEEALQAYDYALALDDEMVSAYMGKASLLSWMGRESEAAETLNTCITTCPYDEAAYSIM